MESVFKSVLRLMHPKNTFMPIAILSEFSSTNISDEPLRKDVWLSDCILLGSATYSILEIEEEN